jgi:hypothetical protein
MGKALKKGPFGPCFPHVFQYATFCYLAVRRKRLPFLRFPCVCPEPVLTNDRFLRHAFICTQLKSPAVFRFPFSGRVSTPRTRTLVRKRIFCHAILYQLFWSTIILPRQALDKHTESTQKERSVGFCLQSTRLQMALSTRCRASIRST